MASKYQREAERYARVPKLPKIRVPKLPKVRVPKLPKIRVPWARKGDWPILMGRSRSSMILPPEETPAGGVLNTGLSALGAGLRGLQYVSEMPYRAVHQLAYPQGGAEKQSFGQRLKGVMLETEPLGYEPPSKLVGDTIKSMLVGYGGMNPESRDVRILSGAGGLLGSLPMDLLGYVGLPSASRAATTITGKALSGIVKPFVYTGMKAQKYLIKPAEAALRASPSRLSRAIAKEYGLGAAIAAPIRYVGGYIGTKFPKMASAYGAVKKELVRMFVLSPIEKQMKEAENYNNYVSETIKNVPDGLARGRVGGRVDVSSALFFLDLKGAKETRALFESWGSPRVAHGRLKAVAREIKDKLGNKYQALLMEAGEYKAVPFEQTMKPSGLSDDAVAWSKAYETDRRVITEELRMMQEQQLLWKSHISDDTLRGHLLGAQMEAGHVLDQSELSDVLNSMVIKGAVHGATKQAIRATAKATQAQVRGAEAASPKLARIQELNTRLTRLYEDKVKIEAMIEERALTGESIEDLARNLRAMRKEAGASLREMAAIEKEIGSQHHMAAWLWSDTKEGRLRVLYANKLRRLEHQRIRILRRKSGRMGNLVRDIKRAQKTARAGNEETRLIYQKLKKIDARKKALTQLEHGEVRFAPEVVQHLDDMRNKLTERLAKINVADVTKSVAFRDSLQEYRNLGREQRRISENIQALKKTLRNTPKGAKYKRINHDILNLTRRESYLLNRMDKLIDNIKDITKRAPIANRKLEVALAERADIKEFDRALAKNLKERNLVGQKLRDLRIRTAKSAELHTGRAIEAETKVARLYAQRGPWTTRHWDELQATPNYKRDQVAYVRKMTPIGLDSWRVYHTKHIYLDDSLKEVNVKGLWGKIAEELVAIVRTKGRTKEEIDRLILEMSRPEVAGRRAFNEWGRTNLTRHFSAAEINEAARKAGLSPNKQLVLEHSGLASAKQIMEGTPGILFQRGRLAVVEMARENPELRAKSLDLADILKNNDKVERETLTAWKNEDILVGKETGPLEGLYIYKSPRFGNVLLDEESAQLIHNMRTTIQKQDPVKNLLPVVMKWYDAALSFMKGLTLNWSIGYMTRNFIDDVARMLVGEGAKAVGDGFEHAYRALKSKTISYKFADMAKGHTLGSVRMELSKRGLLQGFVSTESEAGSAEYLQKGLLQRSTKGLRDVNQMLENGRREAFYLGVLRKYEHLTWAEANEKALKAVSDVMFPYPFLTAWEQTYPARIFFFYRFMRFSTPFWIKAMMEKPLLVALTAKLPGATLGEEMTPEEKKFMPSWIKWRGGYMVRKEGKQAVFGSGLGISLFDVTARLWPTRWWQEGLGSLAPNLRIPMENLSGHYFFLDSDILDRNKIYSPAFAKALSALNPAWKGLKARDFVQEIKTQGGRHYWTIPAPALYIINQIRPVNDIMKMMDPRMYGKSWYHLAEFGITGMKEYPVDLAAEKQRQEIEMYTNQLRELASSGIVKFTQIPSLVKGIQASPEQKRQFREVYARYKGALSARRHQKGR